MPARILPISLAALVLMVAFLKTKSLFTRVPVRIRSWFRKL